MHEVAIVLDQFHKFLGPELKAVTGDSQGIDQVMRRVDSLILPLKNVPFDIFDRRYKTSWDAVMSQFREKVDEIEGMTETFINNSFRKLRSAEGAFDLLQKFQNIQSRESINRQMMDKFDDILLQYTKELDRVRSNFQMHRRNPPVYKNYPPVAGAIAWSMSLYMRIKKPILRFRAMEGVFKDSTTWQTVIRQYVNIARDITDACRELFSEWGAKSYETSLLLQQPILGPPMINGAEMPPPPYFVNFSPKLVEFIRETKYLDRMGYKVPEAALNVTLQEDKYHEYVLELRSMLHNYDKIIAQLRPAEKKLLKERLSELQGVLKQGFDPCNWCSLHIPTLIERCTKAINEFQSVVSQIHKSSMMIEEIVTSIESVQLVQEGDFTSLRRPSSAAGEHDGDVGDETASSSDSTSFDLPLHDNPISVSEFYEKTEKARLSRLDLLVRKYRSIGPLLIKIEEIVAFTNTGHSPILQEYYVYWEQRIFNAITKMIIQCMTTFESMLNINNTNRGGRVRPLCRIVASLNANDVVVTPALAEIYKYLSKMVKHIVESAKHFVRWMDMTCKECEPQIIGEDEEPTIVSFYADISHNPHVMKMMLRLNESIHRLFTIINKYLCSWRSYDDIHGLWNSKKRAALEKMAAERSPCCVFFDTRLASYAGVAGAVAAHSSSKDIDFLHIDCSQVALGIKVKANEWKNDFGSILHDQSKHLLTSVRDTVGRLSEQIAIVPQDIDELKDVLNIISLVNEINMDMELKCNDIVERYRTLQMYAIDVDTREAGQANTIGHTWRTLYGQAKTKDLRVVKVKDHFREVTKGDAVLFSSQVAKMMERFRSKGPGSLGMDLDEGVELVQNYRKELDDCDRRRNDLVQAEKLFGLPITNYPQLQDIHVELDKLGKIYDLYSEQKQYVEEMSSMLWVELDISSLLKGCEEREKRVRKFPKALKALSTFQAVENVILAFKESIPLIQSLKNDALKKRHWEKIMQVTGTKFEMNPKVFTLRALFKMNLSRFTDEIAAVVNEAMQEQKIENALKSIDVKWRSTAFELARYKKGNVDKGWVLRSAEDIKLDLEDNQLNLQTMAGSRYVVEFADEVKAWDTKLNNVNECIEIWFKVQSKWMYLESIFIGAEDIRMQLPEEAKKFDAIDKMWRSIMSSTTKNSNVIEACHAESRTDMLRELSERLDRCQKSLSDYLDTKRNAFPRFFFISDDELLSVLGSSQASSIQVHLLKLFDNCKLVKFGRGEKSITGMQSSEMESFAFRNPAPVEGAVEVWMTGVEAEMRRTLHDICKEGVFNYATGNRIKWIEDYIGQAGIMGSQIWWTWEVEDVFRKVGEGDKFAMKNFEKKLTGQLSDLVQIVRQKLSKHLRKKVNTLLIIDVHARDIVDRFVRDSILDQREFAWESQLRFYWDRDTDNVVIRQCTGKFQYGYEFMGLNGRLVITPLTDRCYMTITQALTFNMGTSPAGPAGTGKTETVKDLAKSMSHPCFVINCGEGLDYKAMGSIYSGLVQIGAWGCFDEFNRINVEVLSVVSAQLQAIQAALSHNKLTVDIGLGREMKVNRNVGIFVTMNPGYAGRTELPDNLKALFRPVTMIVPDMMQICEIMLFAEGFLMARVLAKKMTTLYHLAQGQLSKQYHYDFGLRALKSVLVMAGGLKRQYSEMPEDLVLMRALRDSNMPKFVFDDVPLFKGLISDLFPGLDCPRVAYVGLKQCVEDDMEERGYRHRDEDLFQLQVDKAIQMFETMLVRHTTMIVGPTGGGKTVVLQSLQRALLPSMNKNVKTFILNPKAQTLPELYGVLDPVTRDWADGILSKLFREVNEPLPAGKENETRWIIYDGDVDALWIENMNSVMDDNRLLTLPNGERIRLQKFTLMIMETFDLQYASPATISRCGMVYVDPKNLGYRPFYERWVNSRCVEGSKEHEKDLLLELFDKYVPKCIDYVLEGVVDDEVHDRLVQTIPVTSLSMVKQICSMLDALLHEGHIEARDDLEGTYSFSVLWSVGGALVGASRQRFDAFLKNVGDGACDVRGSLYEMFYCHETSRWQEWNSLVGKYEPPVPFHFYEVMVPTKDSVLYTFLLEQLNAIQKPVLFVGEPGTAKTATVHQCLKRLDPDFNVILNINMSSRTTSMDVQTNICDNVDKRTGHVYGPKAGKKLVIFIDDMNST